MEKNNERSTSKYLYTAAVVVTDVNDLSIVGLPDIKLPFMDTAYALEVDGVIKAGYDLSDVIPPSRRRQYSRNRSHMPLLISWLYQMASMPIILTPMLSHWA